MPPTLAIACTSNVHEPVVSRKASVSTPRSRARASSLLARVACGEQQAVKQCIAEYGGLIWSLTRSMIHSRSEAEDAVQEIFIALWKHAGRYDPARASERTFVAMIARRRLIDRVRAADRQPTARSSVHSLDELSAATSQAMASKHGRRHIERSAEAAIAANALAELSGEQRRALELSVCQGLSHSEIAEVMEMPLGTIKSHVRRALAVIRKRLLPPTPGQRAGRRAS